MPKLSLDLDSLAVTSFVTVPAGASPATKQPGTTAPVDVTVFLCRPSQNWTCTG